jgi:tetratricopeptide (TPR) repeat protein
MAGISVSAAGLMQWIKELPWISALEDSSWIQSLKLDLEHGYWGWGLLVLHGLVGLWALRLVYKLTKRGVKALAKSGDSPRYYIRRGQPTHAAKIYLKKGKVKKAFKVLTRFQEWSTAAIWAEQMEHYERAAQYRLRLGQSLEAMRLFALAEEHERALMLARETDSIRQLAELYLHLDRLELAAGLFDQCGCYSMAARAWFRCDEGLNAAMSLKKQLSTGDDWLWTADEMGLLVLASEAFQLAGRWHDAAKMLRAAGKAKEAQKMLEDLGKLGQLNCVCLAVV